MGETSRDESESAKQIGATAMRRRGKEWHHPTPRKVLVMSTFAPPMSRHASTRAQQRGLPPLIVDWLDTYGARAQDQGGASILYFDKISRRKLAREVGAQVVDRLRPLLDAYLVMADDGTVITLGWRFKRVPRH
jgi:hypothetical protein